MAGPHAAQADTIKRIPNPQEPVPALALPTAALFFGSLVAWGVSSFLALSGLWPWPISTVINGLAAFVLFTVAHEASHNTCSRLGWVNLWMGRIAIPFFGPGAGFQAFRFIHMQHHRFTNHEDGSDPDHYTQLGPRWLLPLRWMTIDIQYLVWYRPRMSSRPGKERVEEMITLAIEVAAVVALIVTGSWLLLFGLWLLPSRIATFLLAWSFDYLPHNGLHDTPEQNRFHTTRNRIGAEAVLTPIMLYQNYHLVHHLHPLIPFYRYISVWRRSEASYLANDPALSTPLGRPLTVEEYRALRDMP